MKWIRGKYNGKRVGGFRLDFEFNLAWWVWEINYDRYHKNFHIGCFHWWVNTAYEK